MNILVLGATGRVGTQVVSRAIDNGNQVTALIRNPDKMKIAHKNLKVIEGNVLNKDDILNAMSGVDLVVSALSTDGTTTLSQSTPLIIEGMKTFGIKRIIIVGTAGILQSRVSPDLLRYQSSESRNRSTRATEEHHKVYNFLAESDLKWTIVCPTYLSDSEATGNYRIERNFLPTDGVMVSVQDVGEFITRLISASDYINTRVGIAY